MIFSEIKVCTYGPIVFVGMMQIAKKWVPVIRPLDLPYP